MSTGCGCHIICWAWHAWQVKEWRGKQKHGRTYEATLIFCGLNQPKFTSNIATSKHFQTLSVGINLKSSGWCCHSVHHKKQTSASDSPEMLASEDPICWRPWAMMFNEFFGTQTAIGGQVNLSDPHIYLQHLQFCLFCHSKTGEDWNPGTR